MGLDAAITARITATRRRLVAGGLLQPVEWGVPGPRIRGNLYGRRSITWAPLDAYIESRQALDRDRITTDRADDILLVFLEPLAIKDNHIFRWGEPPHVYSVKKITGLLKNAETGTRYASEVVVIR